MFELLYGPILPISKLCALNLNDLELIEGWVNVLGKGKKFGKYLWEVKVSKL